MQKLSSWTTTAGSGPLSRLQRINHSSALQAANERAQNEIAVLPATRADDPRGVALRQLREHHQLDAVLLATQACISLRQLYQLESGESSLFYNDALRDQAGRRVSSLLGVEWETLGQTPLQLGLDKAIKVVNLHPAGVAERPAPVTAPAAADATASVVDGAAVQAPVSARNEAAMPMGLQREAAETLTLAPPTNAQIRPTEPSAESTRPRQRSRRRSLLTWSFLILMALLGTATGLFITQEEPLRQFILNLTR